MLVTLLVANSIKIANHNLDKQATFIESLSVRTLALRKGLASDACVVDIPSTALDLVDPLIYLTNLTPCDVYVFVDDYFNEPVWIKTISGFIESVAEKQNNMLSLKVASKYSFYQEQSFMPKVSSICQNQVYSANCGLAKEDYTINFGSLAIECLTGKIDYSLVSNTLTCNGVTTSLPVKLLDKDYTILEQAYVILGGKFKSRIIGITDTSFYIDLNFTEKTINTTMSIITACDKSYGTCYKKFSNHRHFFGFANTAQQSKNYNIFTSDALHYCGDYEDQESCSLDSNLFGVSL